MADLLAHPVLIVLKGASTPETTPGREAGPHVSVLEAHAYLVDCSFGTGGEPVHVVFAFGAEYIVPAFVAVNSTLHNSRTPSRLRLHLLVEQEIAERVQRAFTRAFGDIAQVTGASNAAGGSTGRRGQASGEEGSDEDVYGWAEDTSMLCRFASGRAPVIRTIGAWALWSLRGKRLRFPLYTVHKGGTFTRTHP